MSHDGGPGRATVTFKPEWGAGAAAAAAALPVPAAAASATVPVTRSSGWPGGVGHNLSGPSRWDWLGEMNND
jgi:tetrahydromethanopterin S-methyltransferase subunit H